MLGSSTGGIVIPLMLRVMLAPTLDNKAVVDVEILEICDSFSQPWAFSASRSCCLVHWG
jgi:hypothetical protein